MMVEVPEETQGEDTQAEESQAQARRAESDRTCWATWCNLEKLQLVPGDVEKAVETFTGTNGVRPTAVAVHPPNEKLASELGDGITLLCRTGILRWEVWLIADYRPGGPPAPSANGQPESAQRSAGTKKPQATLGQRNTCNTIQTRGVRRRGRPPATVPVQLMLDLRDIAGQAATSHTTVSRVLRKRTTSEKSTGNER